MMRPVLVLALSLLATAACNGDITGLEPPSDPATETFAASLGINLASYTRTPDGVYYLDQVVGTGNTVEELSDSVRVTYALFLKDGRLVEGSTATFAPAGVIKGFRLGMIGMKVGGKRRIIVPSELAYGRVTQYQLQGGVRTIKIPRQSTLIFDLEVRDVWKTPTTPPAS